MTASAMYGGNILQGALYGAFSGAVAGAVGGINFEGIGGNTAKFIAQVAAAGVTSGIIAELSGAKFSQGAIPAMITAAVMSIGDAIERNNAGKGTSNSSEANRTSSTDALKTNKAEDAYKKWIEENTVQVAGLAQKAHEYYEKFMNSPYRDIIIDEIIDSGTGKPGFIDATKEANKVINRFISDTTGAFKALYELYLEGVNNNRGYPRDQLKCIQGCH